MKTLMQKFNRWRILLVGVAMFATALQAQQPAAIFSYGLVTNHLGVTFNAPVNEPDHTKFTLNQTGATIDGMKTSTPTNITLFASGMTGTNYTLTYAGVTGEGGGTGSGTIGGTNFGLIPIDIGAAASFPSLFSALGTPEIPDLTRVESIGEQIEFNFNFLYTEITGNFDLRVNLRGGEAATSPNGQKYSFGGVVVRTGLAQLDGYLFSGIGLPDAASFPLWLTSYRQSSGGGASSLEAVNREAAVFPNAWLRITRTNEALRAWRSSDGVEWIPTTANDIVNTWPETLYVGLASVGYGGETQAKFDYGHFKLSVAPPPANAAILITQQPISKTVEFGHPATFSVSATITNGNPSLLRYQWFADNVAIPDATNSTLVVEAPTANAVYKVVLSSSQTPSVTSAEATLTIVPDNSAPVVAASGSLITTLIGVNFSEPIQAVTAANFTINQAGATVDSVTMATPTNAVLTVSGMTSSNYTVNATGVKDIAGNTGSGSVSGKNFGLSSIDIGAAASFPSVISPIPNPAFPDQTRVQAIGEQIEFNFNFLYKEASGNFDLRVNLRGGQSANSPNGQRYAFGGVVVRTGLEQLDAYFFMSIGLPNSDSFPLWLAHHRPTAGAGASTLGAPGRDPSVFPNAWLRITREGSTFRAYRSTDGTNWTDTGSAVLDWPDQVYIGLASCGYGGEQQSIFDYANFSFSPIAPRVLSAERDLIDRTKVTVTFSSPLNPSTATALANYSLNNNANISAATLADDGRTVTLTTSALTSAAENILTINGVTDAFGIPVAGNSQITVNTPTDSVFVEATVNGVNTVSLEAEHFNRNLPGGSSRWEFTTQPPTLDENDANKTFSGDGVMFAAPNSGVNVGTPPLGSNVAGSPRLDFRVNFSHPGIYYVWVRGIGDSGTASADDSVMIGLDDALTTRLTGFNDNQGYMWANAAVGDSGPITVDTAGEHVINVWMREDGFVADKILLVSDSAYVPTGFGPQESEDQSAPRIAISRNGSQITITWTGAGTLQASSTVDGDYQNVQGSTNPFPVTANETMRFFRVSR